MTICSPRKRRLEFGDFQTPMDLAKAVVRLLSHLIPSPAVVIEPTCGEGSFLVAAAEAFPMAKRLIGVEINESHLRICRRNLDRAGENGRAELHSADFFSLDWRRMLEGSEEPILVVGNPPWVTNSALGRFGSRHLPPKHQMSGLRGIEALTGKSNFDVSESMLIEQLRWLDNRRGVVAVLCKESVARKVLRRAWRSSMRISSSRIYRFDAGRTFGIAAGACLLAIVRSGDAGSPQCAIHTDLRDRLPAAEVMALRDDSVVRHPDRYDRLRQLHGRDRNYEWRSGIKHDCARVMELERRGSSWRNGLGQQVDIEPDSVYPLLKSSDLMNGRVAEYRKWVVVTQRRLNDDTARLKECAPRTWEYLKAHRERFDRRASSIYRGRPPFSMFGIGDYAFAPWKVAVPGFCKTGLPRLVPPWNGRPVMLDDTTYFLPCAGESEARFVREILASDPAADFFSCLRFPDNKRPVSADTLRLLHLGRLAERIGCRKEYDDFVSARRGQACTTAAPPRLF